jgi:hypothetical protein
MRISKEFQGEFQGKFKENSLFHDDCGKITGELLEDSKRKSRRIPGIITWESLVYSKRNLGGIWEESVRNSVGFLKDSWEHALQL